MVHIGQRLKEARLAAGLSQRQLCGDVITRNMLSQIENGSANPSMDTLRHLAGALGKSVSYFLEETDSSNASLLRRCKEAFAQGAYALCLEQLEEYEEDAHRDEKYLLEGLCLTALAERAAAEGKQPYALELLERAETAATQTLYDTREDKRRRLLLRLEMDCDTALVAALPDITPELLARASASLQAGDAQRCLSWLASVESPRGELLKGDAYVQLKNFTLAKDAFLRAEAAFPRETAECLELCYRELKDFERAYFYACKGRK